MPVRNNIAVNIQVQIFVWTCFHFSWVNKSFAYLFKQLNISYREILKEDESGSLKATIEDILFKAKRKRYVTFVCVTEVKFL